jgi:hypothetical protein
VYSFIMPAKQLAFYTHSTTPGHFIAHLQKGFNELCGSQVLHDFSPHFAILSRSYSYYFARFNHLCSYDSLPCTRENKEVLGKAVHDLFLLVSVVEQLSILLMYTNHQMAPEHRGPFETMAKQIERDLSISRLLTAFDCFNEPSISRAQIISRIITLIDQYAPAVTLTRNVLSPEERQAALYALLFGGARTGVLASIGGVYHFEEQGRVAQMIRAQAAAAAATAAVVEEVAESPIVEAVTPPAREQRGAIRSIPPRLDMTAFSFPSLDELQSQTIGVTLTPGSTYLERLLSKTSPTPMEAAGAASSSASTPLLHIARVNRKELRQPFIEKIRREAESERLMLRERITRWHEVRNCADIRKFTDQQERPYANHDDAGLYRDWIRHYFPTAFMALINSKSFCEAYVARCGQQFIFENPLLKTPEFVIVGGKLVIAQDPSDQRIYHAFLEGGRFFHKQEAEKVFKMHCGNVALPERGSASFIEQEMAQEGSPFYYCAYPHPGTGEEIHLIVRRQPAKATAASATPN